MLKRRPRNRLSYVQFAESDTYLRRTRTGKVTRVRKGRRKKKGLPILPLLGSAVLLGGGLYLVGRGTSKAAGGYVDNMQRGWQQSAAHNDYRAKAAMYHAGKTLGDVQRATVARGEAASKSVDDAIKKAKDAGWLPNDPWLSANTSNYVDFSINANEFANKYPALSRLIVTLLPTLIASDIARAS